MPRKVLLVSHVPSHPGTSGNGARIRSLVGTIKELGHEAHFVYLARKDEVPGELQAYWSERLHVFRIRSYRSTPAPYVQAACQRLDRPLGIKLFSRWYWWLVRMNLCTFGVDDWYDARLTPFLADLQAQHGFDAVIVAYVFQSKALTCFPIGVRKVIDTHDVFANRHQRFFAAGTKPSWFYTTRRQERRGLQRADLVLAIQPQEACYFESLGLGPTRVLTVGHKVEVCRRVQPPKAVEDPALLFLGSDNDVNRDAIEVLQRDLFPRIRAAVPRARLVIVGSASKYARPADGVEIRGLVDDLDELYAEATLILNPIRFGTGLKIKTVEAMAHGKPLVTTSVGVEGLTLPPAEACVVADSADALVEATVAVLGDEERLRRLSRNALAYTEELNRQATAGVAEIFA